ncbi:uncharacterized protein DDB_G0271670 [Chrysoperla carnea]|uniref:uncharacterized protein DDB_G0271670 n=1 Tax=Chrysoperla carnea TaxID=189513 RepID=UPI001D07FFE9|nr:uncharacterized protein DDB_G0271670 [Chrysoperla carnea]
MFLYVKEAYRRWVCSSLVPHFANTNSGNNSSSTNSSSSSSSTTTSTTMSAAADVKRGGSGSNISGSNSKSRSSSISGSGSRSGRRRVRPCRSVCQTVEQRCPYMLPGDRAPAHPTQYAGEPTFLCLDPNIPETGKQALKSSHGSEDCCYTYCETKGVCAKCLDTATPDVATLYNDTSWRVRCTTTPNVPAGATSAAGSSNDQRASNCPSKQQQTTVVVVVTAQQDQPSDDEDDIMNTHASSAAVATSSSTAAVTMHAQAYYLKTIQISIFAVAWTAIESSESSTTTSKT